MATRKIQVRLAVSFQEQVQADSGQPFTQPINEHYNNDGQQFAIGSTMDKGSTTLQIQALGSVVLPVSDIAPSSLDYLFAKADGPFTIQLGSTDVVPVQSVIVKDGPLPSGITSITFTNPSTTGFINLTYVVTGH